MEFNIRLGKLKVNAWVMGFSMTIQFCFHFFSYKEGDKYGAGMCVWMRIGKPWPWRCITSAQNSQQAGEKGNRDNMGMYNLSKATSKTYMTVSFYSKTNKFERKKNQWIRIVQREWILIRVVAPPTCLGNLELLNTYQ